jgi:hypothetical protein
MKGEAVGSYSPIILRFHATAKCLLDWSYHLTTGKRTNSLPPFANKIAITPTTNLNSHQLAELATGNIGTVQQSPFASLSDVSGTALLGKKSNIARRQRT